MESVVQKVIGLVGEKTGVPVIVKADPSLQNLALLHVARHGAPVHIVTYNPTLGSGTDYAICCQCGFLLRAYLPSEADRFDFGMTWRGRREAEKLVNEHLKKAGISLPKEVRTEMKDRLFDGLMTQLRSMPVGMRVDAWLARDYPDLVEQQRVVVNRQLKDNLRILASDVRRLSPEKVLSATVAMNAALAAYWSKTWAAPELVAAYRETGHLAAGESLLKLWYDVPDDPAHDRDLIEAWGQALGLQGWYEFAPFAGSK